MRLFEFKEWSLSVLPEAWGLLPFKKILKRDKSRNKETAFKEMLFIYFYSDIKSDYSIISNLKEKESEIIKDIGLPDDWKIDDIIKEAIDFYEKRSLTVISKLYRDSLKAANDVSDYLTKTDELLNERDDKGKPITILSTILTSLEKITKVMKELKAAEKEIVKEQIETEGRMLGSKTMGMFEEGLDFE